MNKTVKCSCGEVVKVTMKNMKCPKCGKHLVKAPKGNDSK